MTVIVFGSINIDLTTYVPRLPRAGETLHGHSFLIAPGGKGANQAVAAARMGAPTLVVGRVGEDSFGHTVLPALAAEGVNTSQVLIDPHHGTGLAVITVDEKAENSIIVIPGANMALDSTDIARCLANLEKARVLMLQLEVPLAASLEVARAARSRGLTILLDPAPATALPDDVLAACDILTPNEVEAEALVGFRPATEAEAARAADTLRARGVGIAVIKLGGRGVYFAGLGQRGFLPPFPVQAVDTVAAGDAFNGALAVALAEGKGLTEAVRWAAAAGALATTRPGAIPSLPARAEVAQLLADHSGR